MVGSNEKRLLLRSFLVGALVHAILLASSLSFESSALTFLLLGVALPGAMVDISSEMIHPSPTGGVLLAIVGSLVNGGAYAFGAWLVLWQIKRRTKS